MKTDAEWVNEIYIVTRTTSQWSKHRLDGLKNIIRAIRAEQKARDVAAVEEQLDVLKTLGVPTNLLTNTIKAIKEDEG